MSTTVREELIYLLSEASELRGLGLDKVHTALVYAGNELRRTSIGLPTAG